MEKDVNEIKIFIADNHTMVREGLKELIEKEKVMKVIGQASDGKIALDKIKTLHPDIVLLEINLPKINGFDVLRQIKEENKNIFVIFLTGYDKVEYLQKAIEIGAEGYILKQAKINILIDALKTVYEGESYIEPKMATLLFKKINGELEDYIHCQLTQREIEILRLITIGFLNKEIAGKLNISDKTVKNHISNLFKKLKVADRTQAAIYAINHGIVNVSRETLNPVMLNRIKEEKIKTRIRDNYIGIDYRQELKAEIEEKLTEEIERDVEKVYEEYLSHKKIEEE